MDLETMIAPTAIVKDATIGEGTKVWHYANVYGCEIGKNCTIGTYVEIQDNAKVGDNTIISSHSFICSLVNIGDNVFVGHGVKTINDLYPPSRKRTGSSQHWRPTYIGNNVIIGTNSTLFPVRIGDHAVIGAGSVVRKDIPTGQVWAGNPARYVCDTKDLKYEDGRPVFDL